MPVYHFHVNDESDPEGIELSGLQVARCQALKMAGEIICGHDADQFWNTGDWTMTVANSEGMMLFRLVLSGIEAPAILKAVPAL